jgi:hypothetical protein
MGSSATNFTFQADTYFISGTVNLYGTTIYSGGAVIKYTNAGPAKLVCNGNVVCNTGLYSPAVFTSKDDDSVGSVISGSTGNPISYYANPALEIRSSGQVLHDLRFAYASMGVFFQDYSAGTNTARHIQVVRCGKAFGVNGYGTYCQDLALRNVLMDSIDTALYGYSFTSRIEHLTVHQCNQLAYNFNGTNYGTTNWVLLANSILVAVTSFGNVSNALSSTLTSSSSNGVFQTVGAGGFYLASGSTNRNAGTTVIEPTLAAELKELTTYPPVVLENVLIETDTTLAPQAGRDIDVPDLGYHYPPIDWAAIGRWSPTTPPSPSCRARSSPVSATSASSSRTTGALKPKAPRPSRSASAATTWPRNSRSIGATAAMNPPCWPVPATPIPAGAPRRSPP